LNPDDHKTMISETDAKTEMSGLDVEGLLAPIPGDNPAGESLRYEGTYDAIQEARREDDPSLPQGVWKTELKQADWREVELLCTEALTAKTKDAQIAAWLAEAWIRGHRLAGATAGLRLLRELCQRFWPDLYPLLEDDDLDARLAPFEWANEKLPLAIKETRIAEGASAEGALTWSMWESALYRETHPSGDGGDTAGSDEPRSHPSRREQLMEKVHASSTDFYRELSSHLQTVSEGVTSLDATLHEICGDREAPSFGKLRDLTESMSHFVARILKERDAMEQKAGAPMSPELAKSDEYEPAEAAGPAVDMPSGSIGSRADAYRALAAAADFLTATEPHSPAPYLVRRAIKWGRMSLSELLRELLRDNADLPTVYNLLGIRDSDTFEE
jgi:type VI secretion system protein ImpA